MAPSKRSLDTVIDKFWETVPPFWHMVRSHLRGTATGKFDITVEQFHVLRYVRRGVTSISDIATAKNISRPAMSQAVDVLVKKGLLTRVQSTTDRRYVDLALTKAGSDLLESVFAENRAWMKKFLSVLTGEELETMTQAFELMQKIVKN